MSRYFLAILLLFTFCMSCKGQTFQYSRGWTNGKRGGVAMEYNHNFQNLESNDDASNKWNKIVKFPYVSSDIETADRCNLKMLRCLVKMQQTLRTLFIPKVGMSWVNRHDGTDCVEFYPTSSQAKHQKLDDTYYDIAKLNKSAVSNVNEVASDDYESH